MNCYRIKNWDLRYENHRSRALKELSWVVIPNRQDGEGYATIMAHPQAAEIFAVWVLCLQVASRSEPRGSLTRESGLPHTPESLARVTRGQVAWFALALPFLVSEVGWLEVLATETAPSAPAHGPALSGALAPDRAGLVSEKGREGKGIEGNRREPPPTPGAGGAPASWPPDRTDLPVRTGLGPTGARRVGKNGTEATEGQEWGVGARRRHRSFRHQQSPRRLPSRRSASGIRCCPRTFWPCWAQRNARAETCPAQRSGGVG